VDHWNAQIGLRQIRTRPTVDSVCSRNAAGSSNYKIRRTDQMAKKAPAKKPAAKSKPAAKAAKGKR
jgi:hypothetical protein